MRTNNRRPSPKTNKSKPDQRAAALAELFPVAPGQRDIGGLKMIARDLLIPKKQVRRDALADIDGMRENISELKKRNLGIEDSGILQPLTVTPDRDNPGKFRIVFGHRRYFGTENVLEELPCIVVQTNEQAIYLTQGVENIQRKDLSALDEAAFVATLREQFKLSIRDTAAMLGKHRRWVENRVKLHNASADVHEFLSLHGDASGATLTNMLVIEPVKEPRLRRRLFLAAKDGASEKALQQIVNANSEMGARGSTPSAASGANAQPAFQGTTPTYGVPSYGQASTPSGATLAPGSGITTSHTSARADPVLQSFQPAVAHAAEGVRQLKEISITPDYRKRVEREVELLKQQTQLAEKVLDEKK